MQRRGIQRWLAFQWARTSPKWNIILGLWFIVAGVGNAVRSNASHPVAAGGMIAFGVFFAGLGIAALTHRSAASSH